MAWTLAQPARGASATSSPVATLDNTPAPGNLVAAFVSWPASATLPQPAGWKTASAWGGTGGNPAAAIWYRVAGASEPKSLTVTGSTGACDVHLAEFHYDTSLVDPQIDRTAKTDAGAVSVSTLTSEATGSLSVVPDLLLAHVRVAANITSPTWTGATALLATARSFTAWSSLTDQNSKQVTMSWTTAQRSAMSVATISAASIFIGWGIPL